MMIAATASGATRVYERAAQVVERDSAAGVAAEQR